MVAEVRNVQKDKSEKMKTLPQKEFKVRDSILTTLLANNHIKSVHNFFISAFILLAIKVCIDDYFYGGKSFYGFNLIQLAFKDLHLALGIWLLLFLVHLCTYFVWKVWLLSPNNKAWNFLWFSITLFTLFGTFHFVSILCFSLNLPIGCSSIVLFEQTRFIMKSYAFLRSNQRNMELKGRLYQYPSLSKFLYFSFAPTLNYRDEYPRTKETSWRRVFTFIVEVLVSIYFMSLLESEYFIKNLSSFGKEPFSTIDVLYLIINQSVPAFLFLILLVQIIILHAVQNLFAEILRFGDREFFTSWWTITNMGDFYTTWNILIQDWLFEYIYKDLYAVSRSKKVARFSVFLLSITLHEVLLTYVVQIICPMFIISMLISMVLINVRTKHRRFNLGMTFGFLFGQATLTIIGHLEFFAKINCPKQTDALFYVPRIYSCFR